MCKQFHELLNVFMDYDFNLLVIQDLKPNTQNIQHTNKIKKLENIMTKVIDAYKNELSLVEFVENIEVFSKIIGENRNLRKKCKILISIDLNSFTNFKFTKEIEKSFKSNFASDDQKEKKFKNSNEEEKSFHDEKDNYCFPLYRITSKPSDYRIKTTSLVNFTGKL